MLKSILIGAGLGFSAGVQPGPLQAYLLSRVASVGPRRTLPAAFAPLISDGPIALLALLVLGQLTPAMQGFLRTAGGLLLLFIAWRTFRQWRRPPSDAPGRGGTTPKTIFEAALVNLLNPNPYIGWALVLGPVVIAAWREAPANGVAVVASFYATIVTMLASSILAFGSARFLGPKFQRTLLLSSALVLAALGIYQLAVGMERWW